MNINHIYISYQFVCTPALEAVRRISKVPVKVHAWMTAQIAHLVYPYAPGKWGGQGDLYFKIREEAERNGKTPEEVAHKVRDSIYWYSS